MAEAVKQETAGTLTNKQLRDLVCHVVNATAEFHAALAETVVTALSTGELPDPPVATKAVGQSLPKNGRRKEKKKRSTRAPSIFNLYVKDRLDQMQAAILVRRAQEEADLKAGKISALSEPSKTNNNFREAVASWGRLSDAEKEEYKQQKIHEAATAGDQDQLETLAAAGATSEVTGAAPSSFPKQKAAVKAVKAEPGQAASQPAPASVTSPASLASPSTAAAAAEPVDAVPSMDGDKKKKKKKRKSEQVDIPSSLIQPEGAGTEKKKKKKKKPPTDPPAAT